MRGEALGRHGLEQGDDVEVVADDLLVERADERADVGLVDDEPVAGHLDEGLAHGDARDAQLGGDGVLRDAVARAQLTVEDQPAHVLADLVARRHPA